MKAIFFSSMGWNILCLTTGGLIDLKTLDYDGEFCVRWMPASILQAFGPDCSVGKKMEKVYLKCLWRIARECDWTEDRQQGNVRGETDKYRWHQQGWTTGTEKPMGLCLILSKPKAASQRMHNSPEKIFFKYSNKQRTNLSILNFPTWV